MTYDEAIAKANKYRAKAERYAQMGGYRHYENCYAISQRFAYLAEAIRRTEDARFLIWCDEQMNQIEICEENGDDSTYSPEFGTYPIRNEA